MVEDPELCPRFTARLFEDVRIGPSPAWLKARLMAAGQRPINNVVDITNYAMLLTGQPLHAFDFDLVAGGRLVVRRAADGERMTTLDDVERTLDATMLLIDDEDGPTSIAGADGRRALRGRARSTTRVLMEAANWNGPNLQRTSARLVLRTEASGRFEKGLAPEQAMDGQIVATKLMLELTGARLVDGTIDVGGEGPPPATIRLRDEKVERLLGTAVPREECAGSCARSSSASATPRTGSTSRCPASAAATSRARPTSSRRSRACGGWRSSPSRCPRAAAPAAGSSPTRRCAGGSRTRWSARASRRPSAGASPRPTCRRGCGSGGRTCADGRCACATRCPRSRRRCARRCSARCSTACAATTRAGCLTSGCSKSAPSTSTRPGRTSRGRREPLPDERTQLGALLTGALRPPSWREAAPPRADFFAAKGVLAAMLGAIRADWAVEPASEPFLHPGRAARVIVGGEPAGWLGELHPAVAAGWDVEQAAGFELELAVLARHADLDPHYRDLTSFPSVRQDRAWWFPATVAAADVIAVVRDAGGALLAGAEVFDV